VNPGSAGAAAEKIRPLCALKEQQMDYQQALEIARAYKTCGVRLRELEQTSAALNMFDAEKRWRKISDVMAQEEIDKQTHAAAQ
jgi:hypothetical protein